MQIIKCRASLLKHPKYRFMAFALAVVLGMITSLNAQNTAIYDASKLTGVEDLSESLANALLDLSIALRDRDAEAIGAYFDDEIMTRIFPPLSARPTVSSKWIEQDFVDLSDLATVMTKRLELINTWAIFLNAFSEIEDARFIVEDASFSHGVVGNHAESEVKFFVVGRSQDGSRLWVKGRGQLNSLEEKGNWKITLLVFDHLEINKSPVDLFSEVSLPAGVSLSLPAYGVSGRTDFVYHGAAAGDIDKDGFIDVIATGTSNNFVYLNTVSNTHLTLPTNREV